MAKNVKMFEHGSQKIFVFPYFFAIGFILGINKEENSPFSL